MQNISLNSTILDWHIRNSRLLDKREQKNRNFIHLQSLYLSQNKDILSYETLNGFAIIHAVEKVDFQLPYPLVISLNGLRQSKDNTFKERQKLIIPDCTMANLRAFHDSDRPDWIRTDDLKTNVIRIGEKNTNLEYLKSKTTPQFFEEVLSNPIQNWKEWDWNPDTDEAGKSKFGYDFEIPARILSGMSTFQDYLMDRAKLGLKYHIKYSDVYDMDEDRETSERNTYYKIPVAIWEQAFERADVKVRLAMLGRFQEYLLNEK